MLNNRKNLRWVLLGAALFGALSWGSALQAESVELIEEKAPFAAGLVVVIQGDGQLELELAERGNYLVESLQSNWSAVSSLRQRFADANAFPIANAQFARSMETLPYIPQLVNVLVLDRDSAEGPLPSDEEIKRVLAFGGIALVKSQGQWRTIENSTPDNTDEWTHSLHGPGRVPISQDKLINDNLDGLRWVAEN